MNDMDIRCRPGAPHKQHISAALCPHHAEVHKIGFHLVKVGDLQSWKGYVMDLHDRRSGHIPPFFALISAASLQILR